MFFCWKYPVGNIQNEMQSQRDRVHQLEQEYAGLVAQKKERTKTTSAQQTKPTSPDADFLTDADVAADANFFLEFSDSQLFDANVGNTLTAMDPRGNGSVASGGLQTMQDLYTEISEIKEKIQAENESMREVIAEHQRFAQRLTALIESDESVCASPSDEAAAYRRAKLAEPVTIEFCQSFARSAYEDMWQYRQSRGFVSTGLSVFGWCDKRLPFDDRVRFSLQKVFQGRTALELSLRGWGVLSMPQSLETLYSVSRNVKFSTVQVLDDDNKIMFRLMASPDGMILAKTLFMVTRFAIPNGFVICVKSIDPAMLVASELPPGVTEKWVEHSTWVTFETVAGADSEDCVIEFSGELQINPLVTQTAWLLEILFIILRFEGKIMGPVFSLC
jgi:hypothetical protein